MSKRILVVEDSRITPRAHCQPIMPTKILNPRERGHTREKMCGLLLEEVACA
jgi:hypothetical protein